MFCSRYEGIFYSWTLEDLRKNGFVVCNMQQWWLTGQKVGLIVSKLGKIKIISLGLYCEKYCKKNQESFSLFGYISLAASSSLCVITAWSHPRVYPIFQGISELWLKVLQHFWITQWREILSNKVVGFYCSGFMKTEGISGSYSFILASAVWDHCAFGEQTWNDE